MSASFKQSEPTGLCSECLVDYSSIEHAIACGAHSNIPDCCTSFFIHVYWPIPRTKEGNKKRDSYRRWMKKCGFYGEYIPCPDCLEQGRPVRALRSCNCYLGFWYEKPIRPAYRTPDPTIYKASRKGLLLKR